MNYRRPTCPGERQAPTEIKKAEPGEWRYGYELGREVGGADISWPPGGGWSTRIANLIRPIW